MSKMEFLDPKEAEKFKKQKWKQFCWTPCIYQSMFHGVGFSEVHRVQFGFVGQYLVADAVAVYPGVYFVWRWPRRGIG